MPRMRTMTQFKFQVLDFFEKFYLENKYPPTIREILNGSKAYVSTSSVAYALESLAEDGYLTPGVPGQARTQVPTFKEKPAVGAITESNEHWLEEDDDLQYRNL